MRAFNLTIGIVPITMYSHQFIFFMGLIMSLCGVIFKRLEYTAVGLLFSQKTIDAVIVNSNVAQTVSLYHLDYYRRTNCYIYYTIII